MTIIIIIVFKLSVNIIPREFKNWVIIIIIIIIILLLLFSASVYGFFTQIAALYKLYYLFTYLL